MLALIVSEKNSSISPELTLKLNEARCGIIISGMCSDAFRAAVLAMGETGLSFASVNAWLVMLIKVSSNEVPSGSRVIALTSVKERFIVTTVEYTVRSTVLSDRVTRVSPGRPLVSIIPDELKEDALTVSEKVRSSVLLVKSMENLSRVGAVVSSTKVVTLRGRETLISATMLPLMSSTKRLPTVRRISEVEVARFGRALIALRSSMVRVIFTSVKFL